MKHPLPSALSDDVFLFFQVSHTRFHKTRILLVFTYQNVPDREGLLQLQEGAYGPVLVFLCGWPLLMAASSTRLYLSKPDHLYPRHLFTS